MVFKRKRSKTKEQRERKASRGWSLYLPISKWTVIIAIALGIASSLLLKPCILFAGYPIFVDNTLRGTGSNKANVVPDEVIVKFHDQVADNMADDIIGSVKATAVYKSRFAGFRVLKIPPGRGVQELVDVLKKNPKVEYAEPNNIYTAFMVPNDPLYNNRQWNFSNPYYGGIEIEPAWDRSSGSGIIVAIVDTGIAYENYGKYVQAPDLANTKFVPGYDFINNDTHANDDDSHGTHVAGTVAQSTNNNTGVAGVAYGATLMPVKVLDKSGSGTDATVADGIYYATDNGAKVINLSLGGSSPSTTTENAVAYAYNHGVTVVAASGNDGYTNQLSYPAAYDKYVISVGATTFDEQVASYSNRGSTLFITAPGGDTSVNLSQYGYYNGGVLQNTFNPTSKNVSDFNYWFFEGTSMATPHVSGVAALILAKNPTLTPDQVKNRLETTAKHKGSTSGWDPNYGWGIVDADTAVPAVSITMQTDGKVDFGTVGPGNTVSTPSGQQERIGIDWGPANISIKSSNFSDGINTWSMGSANGSNQVKWEFSPNGLNWTTFAAADSYYTLAGAVDGGKTQDIYFRLMMPTSASISTSNRSAQVTLLASAP